MLKFHGSKCKKCGWVEFPIRRICPKCLSKDDFSEVRLADKKTTLFSFSTDTIPFIPTATERTFVRVVAEFEGGGRWEGEMTDGVLEELEVGMPIEMTFRKLERKGEKWEA
jgi:uncharacterized OB-fold protein